MMSNSEHMLLHGAMLTALILLSCLWMRTDSERIRLRHMMGFKSSGPLPDDEDAS